MTHFGAIDEILDRYNAPRVSVCVEVPGCIPFRSATPIMSEEEMTDDVRDRLVILALRDAIEGVKAIRRERHAAAIGAWAGERA